MSKRRAHISLSTKLASALLALGHIPHEEAKKLSAKEIVARFQWDHDPIPHAAPFNGPSEPWNLTPRLTADHAHKTNKDNGTGRSDRQVIARTRKTIKKQAAHEIRRDAERLGEPTRERGAKRRWPSRPIPSRPFPKSQNRKRHARS